MSIFPTKILLATDGSSEAHLAARTAVNLAQKTDSELHVIHVVDVASSIALLYPEATDPERVKQLAPVLKEALERRLEQQGRELLDGEVERVRSAGGPFLLDVRSGRDRRWGRSGRANAAHLGRRSPGLVRGHGLACLPPPVAARPHI
jgi:nucleotide-binding universal stress UspA family protein